MLTALKLTFGHNPPAGSRDHHQDLRAGFASTSVRFPPYIGADGGAAPLAEGFLASESMYSFGPSSTSYTMICCFFGCETAT